MIKKILVFLLFIHNLFVVQSIAQLPDQSTRIKDYLKNSKVVRVYFANSPSMGHQSNTYQMMLQIREMGFNGKFEIIFNDDKNGYLSTSDIDLNTSQKMKYFFPEFIPNSPGIQSLDEGKLVFIPKSIFDKDYNKWEVADLAFTGGQDFDKMNATKIKAKAYLDLYPSKFGGLHPETISYFENNQSIDIRAYNGLDTPAYIPKNLSEVENLLKMKDEVSKSVIAILKQGGITMPIYGLKGYHNLSPFGYADQRLVNIVKNVQEALSDSTNKETKLATSLFVLNQLSEEDKINIKNGLKKLDPSIIVVDLTIGEPVINATDIRFKNKIIVYLTGGVPPDLFNYMITSSQLPPVGGGANFKQIMKQAKRPYLHTQSTSYTLESAPNEWIREKIGPILLLKNEHAVHENLISNAWNEVISGRSNGSLLKFLKESLNGNSPLSNFFMATAGNSSNKLASALDFMIQNFTKFTVSEAKVGCQNLFKELI